jgi:heat shock protein HslJ
MRRSVVLAVLVLALAACGDDTTTGDAEPDPAAPADLTERLAGRTFTAADVADPGHTLVPGSTVTLTFEEGRIAATGGCNRLFAGARIDEGTLVVDAVGGTEMACSPELMAQDDWLVALLEGSPSLDLAGDVLTVTRGETRLTMSELKPSPPVEVEGTRWVLEAVQSGAGDDGSVSRVPQGVVAWLRVDGGAMQVSSGCNRGRGEVVVAGTRWTVGPLLTTKKACVDDGAASVEQAMLTVLDGEVDAVVEGDQLRLTTPDGSAGLTFRDGPTTS